MAPRDVLTATGNESSSRTTCSAVSLAADHLRSNAQILPHFSDSKSPRGAPTLLGEQSTHRVPVAGRRPSSPKPTTRPVAQGTPRCAATGQIRERSSSLTCAFHGVCTVERNPARVQPSYIGLSAGHIHHGLSRRFHGHRRRIVQPHDVLRRQPRGRPPAFERPDSAAFLRFEEPSGSTSSCRRAEYSPSSRRRQTTFVSQADDQTGGPGAVWARSESPASGGG
jgi:hypothetical protein